MTLDDKDNFKSSEQVLLEADRLFTAQDVGLAIDDLAEKINAKLKDTCPIIMAVLNGGLIPCGMLLPKLNFPLQVDYIHATRYGTNTSGGKLHWIAEPSLDIKGRTILLVDDIHDQGYTLKSIIDYCQQQGAEAVYSCVLIHKVHDRKGSDPADFSGLQVPDRYVFGYGMDYKTFLRNAPGIYAVKGM